MRNINVENRILAELYWSWFYSNEPVPTKVLCCDVSGKVRDSALTNLSGMGLIGPRTMDSYQIRVPGVIHVEDNQLVAREQIAANKQVRGAVITAHGHARNGQSLHISTLNKELDYDEHAIVRACYILEQQGILTPKGYGDYVLNEWML